MHVIESAPCEKKRSRARRHPGGPKELAAREHLYGKPDNAPEEQKEIRDAIVLPFRCLVIMAALHEVGAWSLF